MLNHTSLRVVLAGGFLLCALAGVLVSGEEKAPAAPGAAVAPAAPAIPAAPAAKAQDLNRIGPPAVEAPPTTTAPRPAVSTSPSDRTPHFAPLLPSADYSPAVIYIDQPRFDFGSVYKGEVITHRYEVENKGKAPLVISKVKPSCGCTLVNEATMDKVIAPGGKGGFELKIETSRLMVGPQSKYADVSSNDPKQPQARVFIQGKVDSLLKVEPENPKITTVRGTGQVSTELTLTKNSQTEMKILGAKSQSGRLLLELKETQPGSLWNLQVKTNYSPKDTQSYFSETIQLDVQAGERRMPQEVTLTVQVKDRIDLAPRMLYLRKTDFQPLKDKNTPVVKSVDLKAILDLPYKFAVKGTKIDDPNPFFSVKVEPLTERTDPATKKTEPVSDGREYRVSIIVDKMPELKDQNQKSLKGNVTIQTDDPEMPEIQLRVVAFF